MLRRCLPPNKAPHTYDLSPVVADHENCHSASKRGTRATCLSNRGRPRGAQSGWPRVPPPCFAGRLVHRLDRSTPVNVFTTLLRHSCLHTTANTSGHTNRSCALTPINNAEYRPPCGYGKRRLGLTCLNDLSGALPQELYSLDMPPTHRSMRDARDIPPRPAMPDLS